MTKFDLEFVLLVAQENLKAAKAAYNKGAGTKAEYSNAYQAELAAAGALAEFQKHKPSSAPTGSGFWGGHHE